MFLARLAAFAALLTTLFMPFASCEADHWRGFEAAANAPDSALLVIGGALLALVFAAGAQAAGARRQALGVLLQGAATLASVGATVALVGATIFATLHVGAHVAFAALLIGALLSLAATVRAAWPGLRGGWRSVVAPTAALVVVPVIGGLGNSDSDSFGVAVVGLFVTLVACLASTVSSRPRRFVGAAALVAALSAAALCYDADVPAALGAMIAATLAAALALPRRVAPVLLA
jgi:hypothetical protein